MFVLVLALISGCQARFQNVSGDLKFNKVVGHFFKFNQELWIRAVSLQRFAGPNAVYYSISPQVGSGSEILETAQLPKDVFFYVNHVAECINCLEKRYLFFITLEDGVRNQLEPHLAVTMSSTGILDEESLKSAEIRFSERYILAPNGSFEKFEDFTFPEGSTGIVDDFLSNRFATNKYSAKQ